jgi:thiol:disulfide interchange protein
MTTPHRNHSPGFREQPRRAVPPPGEAGLVGAALLIGFLLLALQLWILTVALEEFQRHNDERTYLLAGISAVIFAGGLAVRWLLRRTPSIRRTSVSRRIHPDFEN